MRLRQSLPVDPDYVEFLTAKDSIPEKCLMAAVLWRAYWDLLPASSTRAEDRRSAMNWFCGNAKSLPGFSFREIADTLDLQYKYVKMIWEAIEKVKKFHDHKPKTERGTYRAIHSVVAKKLGRPLSASF